MGIGTRKESVPRECQSEQGSGGGWSGVINDQYWAAPSTASGARPPLLKTVLRRRTTEEIIPEGKSLPGAARPRGRAVPKAAPAESSTAEATDGRSLPSALARCLSARLSPPARERLPPEWAARLLGACHPP